jgi:hypothetical protein
MPNKQHVEKLEVLFKDLDVQMKAFINEKELHELWELIHHERLTTPAEFIFMQAIMETMIHQVKGLVKVKQQLLQATKLVVQEQHEMV